MANALVNGVPTTFYIEEITDEDDDVSDIGGGGADNPHATNEASIWTTSLKQNSCIPLQNGGGGLP